MWAFYFCFESCGWLVWLFEIVDQVFDRMPVRAILSWNSVTGCSLLLVLVVMVLVHAFFVNGTHSSLLDRTHRTHSSLPDQTQKPFLKPIFSHFKIEDSREGIKLPFGPDLSSMGQASIQVLFWVKDFVGLVLLSQVCHKFITDWVLYCCQKFVTSSSSIGAKLLADSTPNRFLINQNPAIRILKYTI